MQVGLVLHLVKLSIGAGGICQNLQELLGLVVGLVKLSMGV